MCPWQRSGARRTATSKERRAAAGCSLDCRRIPRITSTSARSSCGSWDSCGTSRVVMGGALRRKDAGPGLAPSPPSPSSPFSLSPFRSPVSRVSSSISANCSSPTSPPAIRFRRRSSFLTWSRARAAAASASSRPRTSAAAAAAAATAAAATAAAAADAAVATVWSMLSINTVNAPYISFCCISRNTNTSEFCAFFSAGSSRIASMKASAAPPKSPILYIAAAL